MIIAINAPSRNVEFYQKDIRLARIMNQVF